MARRTVLVTGTSTGIGRAVALRLAREGWQVFAGVRRATDGDSLVGEASGQLTPVILDVTDDAAVDAALAEVGDKVGVQGLQALVNNAGVAVGGPLEYLPVDRWRDQFAVNVTGQVAVTKAAMPLLRGSARGARIVFIGSNSGRVATPLMGPYSASKFALEGLADALRMELHGSGIDVTVIQPGSVKTPIWDKGRAQVADLQGLMDHDAFLRYEELIDAVTKGLEAADASGVSPDKVAGVVSGALEAKRPRTRYQVGLDSKISVTLARLLPGRAMDAAIRRMVRP